MNTQMRTIAIILSCGLLFTGFACETGMDPNLPSMGTPDDSLPADDAAPNNPNTEDNLNPAPEPEPTLFGNWRMTAGSFFVDLEFKSEMLVLNEDGTGEWMLKHPLSNALLRIDLLHVLQGDTLSVSFLLQGGIGGDYTMVLDGIDGMRLAGRDSTPAGLVEGRIATFEREPELPVSLRMRSLTVVNRFDELSRPSKINDLVSDGTALYFQTPDIEFGAMQKIDPDTGAILDSFTSFAGAQNIQTTQDGGFWSHCGCGGSNDARLTDGTVSDTVDTEDLSAKIQIHAMAFDPAARRLWLTGSNNQGKFKMLEVDADAEPDVLIESRTFAHRPDGLTTDGTDLWVIINVIGGANTSTIVQIDKTTLKAIATYESPDPDVEWTGITFHNDRLFLLGADAADEGVIVEVAPE